MKRFAAISCMILTPLFLSVFTFAQQEQMPVASAPVPHLVQYAGTVAGGATEPIAIRFSLYATQTGGDALWSETQTISPDSRGRYSALLGSATPEGLPQQVFSSAEAKWLGVTIGDTAELARTILVATPYALKSNDAETLGGHPVSDFLLSGEKSKAQPAAGTDITQINVGNGVTGGGTGPTVTLGLSSTYLENLGNEIYPQLGGNNTLTGKNIFTAGKLLLGTSPVLSVANVTGSSPVTVTASGNTVKIGLSDSALVTLGNSVYAQLGAANTFTKPITFASGQTFPGTISLGANNTFTGSNTFSKAIIFAGGQTFPGTVSLSGNNAFTGSDSFSNPITFASGQTFPGTGSGTITGVTAGTGLSGGGSSGAVTVSLNTSYLNSNYASLSSSDSFTSPVTMSGSGAQQLTVTTSNNAGYAIKGTASGTSGVGVYASGPTGLFGIGTYGIQAYTTNTTTGTAIYTNGGTSPGGTGVNVSGFTAVNAAGSNTGFASSLAGDGTGVAATGFIGVLAQGANSAQTNYLAGTGVYATGYNAVVAEASGSTGYGVYASGATAVEAVSSANDGTAVVASASGSQSAGVVGISADGTSGIGVTGRLTNTVSSSGINGTDGSGVWGDAGHGNAANGAGVLGTADNGYAGEFVNNSGEDVALYTQNNSTSTGSNVAYFKDGVGNYCYISYGGNLKCNGAVNVVPKRDDNRSIEMYSPQATENWFEDYGGGHLTNGSATVALDPTYAAMVNTGVEYRVFLTPNGDCRGLYVASKSVDSFEVRELGGGHTNLSFDYKIVAKRKGMEDVRMRDVSEQQKQREEVEEARRQHQVRPARQVEHRGPLAR